jgi:hypothetical protein
LKELKETNEAELKKFEERQAEPEKLEDERDVVDAIQDKANCLTKIGDKVGLRLTPRNVHCTYYGWLTSRKSSLPPPFLSRWP